MFLAEFGKAAFGRERQFVHNEAKARSCLFQKIANSHHLLLIYPSFGAVAKVLFEAAQKSGIGHIASSGEVLNRIAVGRLFAHERFKIHLFAYKRSEEGSLFLGCVLVFQKEEEFLMLFVGYELYFLMRGIEQNAFEKMLQKRIGGQRIKLSVNRLAVRRHRLDKKIDRQG